MNYLEYIATEDEDLAQEAWCRALAKTDHRPATVTMDELVENYQHIAGLVSHIFKHEKYRAKKRGPIHFVPLTERVGMVYNREDALEDCTPEQLEAIRYYLSVIDQGRPLSVRERTKLKRLRQATGLALEVPRHKGG